MVVFGPVSQSHFRLKMGLQATICQPSLFMPTINANTHSKMQHEAFGTANHRGLINRVQTDERHGRFGGLIRIIVKLTTSTDVKN